MYQVDMVDENYLVQQVEEKKGSEFAPANSRHNQNGAIYKIFFAPADGKYKADELVLLHPGSYEALYLNGELLTTVTESRIIAKITETK